MSSDEKEYKTDIILHMKRAFVIFAPVIIAASVLVFIAFTKQGKTDCYSGLGIIRMGMKKFDVEIADTPKLREKGLSGHSPLSPTQGMLFTFGNDNIPRFWMKDMLFPIHIIWINNDMEVVGVEGYLTPETYPKTYSPNSKIRYVLEVGINAYENVDQIVGQSVAFDCKK